LRRLRKLRGLSQTDVTVLLGWSSQNYISELECGKANPTAAQMQALARKLGGNVRVFIELDTKDP
jgi:transcriptional regulator with XRE-family HTH domain